jgi:hypothetical protein
MARVDSAEYQEMIQALDCDRLYEPLHESIHVRRAELGWEDAHTLAAQRLVEGPGARSTNLLACSEIHSALG